jgi:hypothetical protein
MENGGRELILRPIGLMHRFLYAKLDHVNLNIAVRVSGKYFTLYQSS